MPVLWLEQVRLRGRALQPQSAGYYIKVCEQGAGSTRPLVLAPPAASLSRALGFLKLTVHASRGV